MVSATHQHELAFCSCFSVSELCLTLCGTMDCSTPEFPVLHHLPELAQTHVHWVSDTIHPSHPLSHPFSCLQSFPVSRSFLMSCLFTSGGQSIGDSASTSVLSKNIQGWFPLGLTGLIFLMPKGLSRVFFNHKLKASNLWCSAFFKVQLSHPYIGIHISPLSNPLPASLPIPPL